MRPRRARSTVPADRSPVQRRKPGHYAPHPRPVHPPGPHHPAPRFRRLGATNGGMPTQGQRRTRRQVRSTKPGSRQPLAASELLSGRSRTERPVAVGGAGRDRTNPRRQGCAHRTGRGHATRPDPVAAPHAIPDPSRTQAAVTLSAFRAMLAAWRRRRRRSAGAPAVTGGRRSRARGQIAPAARVGRTSRAAGDNAVVIPRPAWAGPVPSWRRGQSRIR